MLLSGLFAFYLSLYFLRLHEYRPETAQTSILFITLLACLMMYLLKKEKNLRVIQTPFVIGFVVAAVLSHVAIFYMQGAIDTADELVRLAALYFISCALFVDKSRLEFYFKLMAFCALVIAIHGIHQFHSGGIGWTGIHLYRGERVRYLGVFNDPNDMGMLLLITIPMIFYLLRKSKNIMIKFAWILILATIFYGIYLTGSRGTLLGLLALIFAFALFKMSKAMVIISMLVAVPLVIAVTQFSTISFGDASSAGRIDAWGEGIQMLKSNPLFGVGHGLFKDHHNIAAHSSYVEVFSETGLLGYFFWLGFIVMSIYGLYRFSFHYSLPETATDLQAENYSGYRLISNALISVSYTHLTLPTTPYV